MMNYFLLIVFGILAVLSVFGLLFGNWISILPALFWGWLSYRSYQRIIQAKSTKTKNNFTFED